MRVPRYDVPKAAPEPLRLIQVFVNTLDVEHGRDSLTPNWLREHDLAGERAPGERALAYARTLREALRAALRRDAAPLDRLARRVPVRARFDVQDRPRLEAVGEGPMHMAGILLAIVHDAQLEGTWSRLKTCRQCRWAFYDYSRNRSATWCSMSICGNRRKTRSYRRRQARKQA